MSIADAEQRVEAARYALLRRLAHSLRHHVASHLQPIGMITDVMERRLGAASPDLEQVRTNLSKVNVQARAAVQSSLDVVVWIAPEAGQLVALDAGVEQCVDLLRGYLSFRGFALRSEVGALPQPVSLGALRSTLPAVLLALTDESASPADAVVTAREEDRALLVTVALQPSEGSPGFPDELHYRAIEWDDVDAIAAAEGVACTREGNAVTLAFAA